MSALSGTEISLVLLSAYSLAGCLMEHFVVFYGWTLTQTVDELKRIQTPSGVRTGIVYIIPKTVLTSLLVYYATLSASDRSLHGHLFDIDWISISVAMLAVSWASSFLVQIPLQLHIQKTGARKALEKLVKTDWVRVLTMVAHCAIIFAATFGQL
jgi:hypothetical protein